MLRAKLEQVQDALDDASDKIETAQQLLSIEGEPAAVEYATSQLDGALSVLDDAAEAADTSIDADRLLDTSFRIAARPRAHRFLSRSPSQFVRGQLLTQPSGTTKVLPQPDLGRNTSLLE